jgi:hypothetical protein
MSEKPENTPSETTNDKTLELTDLPAYKEGEDVKGGVYSLPISIGTPSADPVCSTGLLSTCRIYDSQVDTFCKGQPNC